MPLPNVALGTLSALALAACGAGEGGTPNSEAQAQASGGKVATSEDEQAAVRFLDQAGLGATTAEVKALTDSGLNFNAWLDAQFAMVPVTSAWQIASDLGIGKLDQNKDGIPDLIGSDFGLDNALWYRLFKSPDVLRQRIVLALSEIFVVSIRNMPIPWGQFACLAYWDILESGCFGTFRELIERITLSPAMGVYLSMRGSQKADPVSGRRPDENYARELLQLFTIGLKELDDNGMPTANDTYTNEDVMALSRVLTGWDFDVATPPAYVKDQTPDFTRLPMKPHSELHDEDDKTFLGLTIKGKANDAVGDLEQALDHICDHHNVPFFFSRQLIQRLVMSNPTPDYVMRVAAKFKDNGQGVRGDLKAVIRAVLTDPTARDVLTGLAAVQRSKLREPMLRFVQWGRLARLQSTDNLWSIGDLSAASRLAQSPMRSPSVFNFFRPGYVPLNSGVSADGFVAPEFQITDESSVVGYANFMWNHMDGAPAQAMSVDYSEWTAIATDATKLVDRLNLMLSARAMSSVTVERITKAIDAMKKDTSARLANRVKAAFYLILVSPDYMVQR
ncbi:DUF1800 domain-containing protein [Aquabacterium sp.]|uniref:DUF1800 domain-containing protein n=1 Tax=Aquabacterium sp. TaxID=1872578 RepID=UPI0025C1B07C|nr:DUF1800 domain-containing protein [Aquabacterium sp.]